MAGQRVWRFVVNLRIGADDELIAFLERQENKSAAIRDAIRALIEKEARGDRE